MIDEPPASGAALIIFVLTCEGWGTEPSGEARVPDETDEPPMILILFAKLPGAIS